MVRPDMAMKGNAMDTLDKDLLALAIRERDLADKAGISRASLLDAMQAAGFTADNLDAKRAKEAGSNTKVWRHRGMMLALAAIKHQGKRLNMDEVAEIMGDNRAARKIIKGLPCGSINGVTTWYGNATSHLAALRKDLLARETAAAAQEETGPKPGSTWEAKTLKTLAAWEEKVQKLDAPSFDVPAVIETIRQLAKLIR
jgi:hypothetical protein